MAEIEYVELGSICEVVRGGSPRPIIDYITEDDDGVNWLKIGDVSETDKYFTHANEKIKPSGISKTRPVVAGDLILSNSMSFGRAFITLIDGYIHDGWLRLRCDTSKIDKEYLYYFLTSSIAQNQFKAVATGSVVNNLKADTVKATQIALPTLAEQKKIATVLSMIDEKIVINNAVNRNLLDQGRALYEDLISKYEINAKLSDLISSIETGSRPKGGAQESGVPSIGAEKIESFGVYDYSGEKYISEEFFEKSKRGHILSGDVLLYKDGAYTGKTSMALNDFPHAKCAINEHVYKLNSNNNLYQFFLYFTLDNKKNRDYIYTLASSKAAQPGLNQTELLSVDIAMPVETSLIEFEKNVSEMMNMIASNAKENRKLTLLRDSLLPKLMSGEIDVSELDV